MAGKLLRMGLLTTTCVATLMAGGAQAQQADIDPAPAAVVDEVVVTGVRGSVVRALTNKQRDMRVTDSIQAEDIGKFPDANLAESLQRVPGVSLERSVSGNSRTITVRGLSSQFTRVEINGMAGATGGGGRSSRFDSSLRNAGNDGRNFSFDVLPSELFTSAVIAKSPQARNAEGGIAAVVELKTPGAFDFGGQTGSLSVEGNWGEDSSLKPKISGLYSHRFNDVFGVLVGGVYSRNENLTRQQGYNRFVRLSTVVAQPANYSQGQLNALVPDGTQDVVRERDTETYTFLASTEWRPNADASLRFDAIYSQVDGIEQETQGRYRLTGGLVPTSLNIQDGVVRSGSLSAFTRSEIEFESNDVDDNLQQYTLNGDFALGAFAGAHWSVHPFAGYSKRTQRRPFSQINAYGAAGGFDWNLDKGVTDYSTTAPGFGSNPEKFRVANVFSSNNRGQSEEYDTALDFKGDFDGDVLKAVRFGARFTARSSAVSEPFFGVINTGASPTLADHDLGSRYGLFFADIPGLASDLLGGQNQLEPGFVLGDTRMTGVIVGSNASNLLAQSDVSEDTTAAYVEADFRFGRLDVNTGVRFVSTDVTAKGAASVNGVVNPVSQSGSYSETLPSVNAKYHLTDTLFLRGAWSRALSRPSLAALAPRETFNFTSLIGTRGNPDLKPFVVDQFDLGAEWYFHPEGLIAATMFKKRFSSLIASEAITLDRQVTDVNGAVITRAVEFTQPYNTGGGEVEGLEVTLQSSLYFLPAAFQDLGVLFNYTKLESSTDIGTQDGNQAQPFPNLSPSSFNASVYYDNGRFDARVNYAWRDGFLQDGIDPAGNFPFQEAFGQLDLTMNYRLNDQINLQMQATNLTDEALKYSSSLAPLAVSEIALERRVAFGLRYSF
jgi:TonB-dependent receptor